MLKDMQSLQHLKQLMLKANVAWQAVKELMLREDLLKQQGTLLMLKVARKTAQQAIMLVVGRQEMELMLKVFRHQLLQPPRMLKES